MVKLNVNMFVSVLVLAAGKGARLKSRVPKPLVKILNKPAMLYALEEFNRHPLIKEIIIVVNSDNEKKILSLVSSRKINKVIAIVKGGKRRQDSVVNGLKALGAESELVLIHDAARPFINRGLISSVINYALKFGAAIPAVPVKVTIKKAKMVVKNLCIEKTVARENLWEAHTPQGFKTSLIRKAYDRFGKDDVTDDASLIEKIKVPVAIVSSSVFNIKITTPEDLLIAEAIARKLKKV